MPYLAIHGFLRFRVLDLARMPFVEVKPSIRLYQG